ncbi:MAG: ATP-binding protein [Bacteroidia bacterium]|nr:ATP-binding protein [Bacteroidia bacterium]MDW8235364.1 ATP-binding protein [Bacteroidia bacterium]
MSQVSIQPQADHVEIRLMSHLDEIARIEGHLSAWAREMGLQAEKISLFIVAVTEAISNAILHGNRQSPQKEVRVRLSYSNLPPALAVEVQDEGEGFNPESIPDPTHQDNLLKEGGRGIFLMRNIADNVEFLEGGRCVRLLFFRK